MRDFQGQATVIEAVDGGVGAVPACGGDFELGEKLINVVYQLVALERRFERGRGRG